MRHLCLFQFLVMALYFSWGCAVEQKAAVKELPVMIAHYTPEPINLDGKLDEPGWQNAPVYPLVVADDVKDPLLEGGKIRLAWDDKYFYLGAELVDSDVVAEGEKDQLRQFLLGDVVELFLKPDDQTWYWELYVTPRGNKSSYWFPGRGRVSLDSAFNPYECGLKVAATYDGTLNNWQDVDKGWTAEMAMPISELTKRGESFGPRATWRILVGRYNHSRYLYLKELSATPKLSITNFHTLKEYAILRLTK